MQLPNVGEMKNEFLGGKPMQEEFLRPTEDPEDTRRVIFHAYIDSLLDLTAQQFELPSKKEESS